MTAADGLQQHITIGGADFFLARANVAVLESELLGRCHPARLNAATPHAPSPQDFGAPATEQEGGEGAASAAAEAEAADLDGQPFDDDDLLARWLAAAPEEDAGQQVRSLGPGPLLPSSAVLLQRERGDSLFFLARVLGIHRRTSTFRNLQAAEHGQHEGVSFDDDDDAAVDEDGERPQPSDPSRAS